MFNPLLVSPAKKTKASETTEGSSGAPISLLPMDNDNFRVCGRGLLSVIGKNVLLPPTTVEDDFTNPTLASTTSGVSSSVTSSSTTVTVRVYVPRTFHPSGNDAPAKLSVRVLSPSSTELPTAVTVSVALDDSVGNVHVLPLRLPPETESL